MLPVDQPLINETGFIHEIKWDGYRALAYLDQGAVSLESRNGRNLNARFPYLVRRLQENKAQMVLDGEVVAFTEEGRVDFSLLQQAQKSADQIRYVVFDVLYYLGENLCSKPWHQRRQYLDTLIEGEGLVFLSPLLPWDVQQCFSFAAEHQLEGIVSKQMDSPYFPGTRSPLWRKQKIKRDLDCIVAGLKVDCKGVRSMAVGLYQSNEKCLYLGNVGSGLGQVELDFLRKSVRLLASDHCPLLNPPKDDGSWIWFRPFLVAEVEYSELTPQKRLRHPVFLRFRLDKKPEDCNMDGELS